jgi:hypothetical protein
MKPVRIQRQRTKGWKLPENTVNVARPGRWGNPFKVHASRTAEEAVRLFRCEMPEETREAARRELAGKNLACWCKPGEPCHGDVLLEIANG